MVPAWCERRKRGVSVCGVWCGDAIVSKKKKIEKKKGEKEKEKRKKKKEKRKKKKKKRCSLAPWIKKIFHHFTKIEYPGT